MQFYFGYASNLYFPVIFKVRFQVILLSQLRAKFEIFFNVKVNVGEIIVKVTKDIIILCAIMNHLVIDFLSFNYFFKKSFSITIVFTSFTSISS